MSKAIVLLLALVACTFAAPFDQVKAIVERDQCGTHGMETIRPKIQNKIEELKIVRHYITQNPENAKAQAELLALIEDVKSVYDTCGIQKKIEPALGDAVKNAGIAFLLASNCFKDVGALLLIGDSVLEDPSNITNDVIVAIFLYIMGRQTTADCEQFLGFIL